MHQGATTEISSDFLQWRPISKWSLHLKVRIIIGSLWSQILIFL